MRGGIGDMAGGAGFGGNGRRFFTEPLTRRARVGSPRFSLCPACPKRPLCSGDGLRAWTPYLTVPNKKRL
jgi:hypothetical protein